MQLCGGVLAMNIRPNEVGSGKDLIDVDYFWRCDQASLTYIADENVDFSHK